MMSLRSIAGEIGLYLLVKMYLAVNKWSHGADVWGACNVRTPRPAVPCRPLHVDFYLHQRR
jgi:hypothetical protein